MIVPKSATVEAAIPNDSDTSKCGGEKRKQIKRALI